MAKISNTIKVKKDDGKFEDIQISYIAPEHCTIEGALNKVGNAYYAHAEGYNNSATGDQAHAEGKNGFATGSSSHVEGTGCRATTFMAHAEGMETRAGGLASHSEGRRTTALGESSHVEGYKTTAYGFGAHAEGDSTNMITDAIIDLDSVDNDAIIDAWNTNKFTLAFGPGSHAEGDDTLALGQGSHTEGGGTIASGDWSHAEGGQTTASGEYSHAEGYGTQAAGKYSHASGYYTNTPYDFQFAIGRYNEPTGQGSKDRYVFMIGNGEKLKDGTITRSNAMTVDSNGKVAASIFTAKNNRGFYSEDSWGFSRRLVHLNSANNLMIGNYTSNAHGEPQDGDVDNPKNGGDTYINSFYGDVYLRNATASIRFEPYFTSSIDGVFEPEGDAACSLGREAYRWYRVWAANSSIQTSDEREKSDIMSIADYPVTYSRSDSGNIFEQLFDKLVPKTYTLDIEDGNDIHIGFIAQDVEKAANELGLTVDDLGLIDHSYWTDKETGEEKDRYGLAYEEFMALNTYIIQKQKTRITELETQLVDQEERITKLEKLINNN